MVEATIFRPATVDEKKDFTEIGKKDFRWRFRQRLIKEEENHFRQKKPFCYRCAKMDFQDKVSNRITEAGRVSGNENDIELDKEIQMDLSPYSDQDRFELKETKDIVEDKLIDGIRQSMVTGKYYVYKCKKRGCGITIEVKNYEEGTVKKPKK